ncbi:MAG: alpha/beta hydrolase [Candidatus Bathyarchaeota archaeon]|nr:alpha/beta hydrolase [Candidatus Bathyarchaeota archaeon]
MVEKGVFSNGVPYVCFGEGEKSLLVFSGGPGITLPSGFMIRVFGQFKHLSKNFVIYAMSRKNELPQSYTTRDMAEDYAAIIRDEFDGGPVDVMGMSYGGLIAQHLAADHPELIRRLVIAMSVYRFSEEGNELDMKYAQLLSEGKKREALKTMYPLIEGGRITKAFMKFFMGYIAPLMWLTVGNPVDLLVEGKAEMAHNSKNRLAEIKAPTLVIGGDKDYYCPVERFRETAAEIPNAKLVLYEGKGHMNIMGKKFDEDVLAFLNEESG